MDFQQLASWVRKRQELVDKSRKVRVFASRDHGMLQIEQTEPDGLKAFLVLVQQHGCLSWVLLCLVKNFMKSLEIGRLHRQQLGKLSATKLLRIVGWVGELLEEEHQFLKNGLQRFRVFCVFVSEESDDVLRFITAANV